MPLITQIALPLQSGQSVRPLLASGSCARQDWHMRWPQEVMPYVVASIVSRHTGPEEVKREGRSDEERDIQGLREWRGKERVMRRETYRA